MPPARVTPEEMKERLSSLAAVAASFMHGRGRQSQRLALRREFMASASLLKAEIVQPTPRDPDALIQSFLENGGDWFELIATVNRIARGGAPRKN